MDIQSMIESAGSIIIFTGEGEEGTWEKYTGKRTVRAIKARLTRERCGGDRWVSVWLLQGNDDDDTVYDCLDLDTGGIVDTRNIDPDDIED